MCDLPNPEISRISFDLCARFGTNDKLKEALIKYDRLLACRGLPHDYGLDRRQANSLSYLIRAS